MAGTAVPDVHPSVLRRRDGGPEWRVRRRAGVVGLVDAAALNSAALAISPMMVLRAWPW